MISPRTVLTLLLLALVGSDPAAAGLEPQLHDAPLYRRALDPITIATGNGGVGDAVALDGDWAVVAAPYTTVGSFPGAGAGRVFLYHYDAASDRWRLEDELDGPFPNGRFGNAVALDGARGLLAVSTTFGTVAVFAYDGASWELEAAATRSGISTMGGAIDPGGAFGFALDLDDGALAVGAPHDAGGGKVYLFRRDAGGWTSDGIVAPGLPDGHTFGSAVALDGDRLLVGDPADGTGAGAGDAGRALLYQRGSGGWTPTATITPLGDAGTRAGAAVDLDGDLLAIGQPDQCSASTFACGAVHVYRQSGAGWDFLSRFDGFESGDVGSTMALDGGVLAFTVERPGAGWAVRRARYVGGSPAWRSLSPIDVAGDPGDAFGRALALDSGRVLVGAPGTDAGDGDAHLFRTAHRGGRLDAGVAATDDGYGSDLATAGDVLAVGAPGEDQVGDGAGAVHLFLRYGDEWDWVQTLVAPVAERGDGDRFGAAVAVSPSYVLVGAPGHDDGGVGAGRAFLYARSGDEWSHVASYAADTPAAFESFGWDVALLEFANGGARVVIGAPGDDGGGAAYVTSYSPDTPFVFRHRLAPADVAAGDLAGFSVAVAGSMVALGAPGTTRGGKAEAGAVHTFRAQGFGWIESTSFGPSGTAGGEHYGESVALGTLGGLEVVVAGAPDASYLGIASGYVASWVRNGGTWEGGSLAPPSRLDGARFGARLSLSGDRLTVVAQGSSVAPESEGTAYLYRGSGTRWSLLGEVWRDAVGSSHSALRDDVSAATSGHHVFLGQATDDGLAVDAGTVRWGLFVVPDVFADGFESGDTTAWSAAVD